MNPKLVVAACLLACAGMAAAKVKPHDKPAQHEKAAAQDKAAPQDQTAMADQAPAAPGDGDAKEVSGMSIVGNSETPKSLTIIPWKSSEIGRDTDFRSSLLGQEIAPIDKPSFLRGLDFYKFGHRSQVSVKE